jgi:hypothetical protein
MKRKIRQGASALLPEGKSASPDGALQGHLISFQALPQTIPPGTRTLVDDALVFKVTKKNWANDYRIQSKVLD